MARPKNFERKSDRRSAKVFIIACEGEKTETLYFTHITEGLRRVRVVPLPTGRDGRNSPLELVNRLKAELRNFPDAEAWIVFDCDNHFQGAHFRGTRKALIAAQKGGYQIAISNPCIELWFLLHLEEVTGECDESHCTARLKQLLSSYNHSRYRPEELRAGVTLAIERAKKLDVSVEADLPSNPGSRIYRLMEELRAVVVANGMPAPF